MDYRKGYKLLSKMYVEAMEQNRRLKKQNRELIKKGKVN